MLKLFHKNSFFSRVIKTRPKIASYSKFTSSILQTLFYKGKANLITEKYYYSIS